jgi:hypothetical protein
LRLVCGMKMKYCVHVFNIVTQKFIRQLSQQTGLTYGMDSKVWTEKESIHYCEWIWLLIQNDVDLFDHMFFTYEFYFTFIHMLTAEYGSGYSWSAAAQWKNIYKVCSFVLLGGSSSFLQRNCDCFTLLGNYYAFTLFLDEIKCNWTCDKFH